MGANIEGLYRSDVYELPIIAISDVGIIKSNKGTKGNLYLKQ